MRKDEDAMYRAMKRIEKEKRFNGLYGLLAFVLVILCFFWIAGSGLF